MKKQTQFPSDDSKQLDEHMKSEISKHVFQNLGQPGHLQSLQVRHLWNDKYRVNVLLGVNAASANVAHSYFMSVDNDGRIISSTPLITKLY